MELETLADWMFDKGVMYEFPELRRIEYKELAVDIWLDINLTFDDLWHFDGIPESTKLTTNLFSEIFRNLKDEWPNVSDDKIESVIKDAAYMVNSWPL